MTKQKQVKNKRFSISEIQVEYSDSFNRDVKSVEIYVVPEDDTDVKMLSYSDFIWMNAKQKKAIIQIIKILENLANQD